MPCEQLSFICRSAYIKHAAYRDSIGPYLEEESAPVFFYLKSCVIWPRLAFDERGDALTSVFSST
jgi:hypothetical protein